MGDASKMMDDAFSPHYQFKPGSDEYNNYWDDEALRQHGMTRDDIKALGWKSIDELVSTAEWAGVGDTLDDILNYRQSVDWDKPLDKQGLTAYGWDREESQAEAMRDMRNRTPEYKAWEAKNDQAKYDRAYPAQAEQAYREQAKFKRLKDQMFNIANDPNVDPMKN